MTLDRSLPPPSQSVNEVNLIEAKTHTLSNGVPVHFIPAGKEPVVGIEILFPRAGTKHEPRAGIGFFTVKMLSEGSRRRSAFAISNFIDSYGAYLQLSPGLDYSSLELYTLTKYTDALLALIAELLTEATFPEDELRQLKAIQIQKIRVNNEKTSIVASKKFRSVLFGKDEPYGRSLTETQVNSVSKSDLENFYQGNILSNWEIVVAGQVDDEILTLIEKHLGTLPVPKLSNPPQSDIWGKQESPKKHLVDRPDNLQSSLRVGLPLISKSHSDFIPIKILNTVLGGYFGSRLMKNIREEKGLTYGIYASIVTLQEAGYLVVGTDVKKDLTRQALTEIYHEIELLRDNPIGEVELNIVKNYMAGRLLTSVDTPFALAEKFKSTYLHGLSYEYYQTYLKTINTIDSGTLMEMAERYFPPENWYEVVVGGYE